MLECQNLLELEKRLARSETPGEGDIIFKKNQKEKQVDVYFRDV